MMGCCGGRTTPLYEPHADCPDGRKEFAPDAWVIAVKFGLDPCAIEDTGKGGRVLRDDVLRELGR